jgi:hypothetical protein
LVRGLEEISEDLPLIDFCNTIDASTRILKNQNATGQISGGKVLGSLIKLDIPKRLVVVGDIHGDYGVLNTILSRISYERVDGVKITFGHRQIVDGIQYIGLARSIQADQTVDMFTKS